MGTILHVDMDAFYASVEAQRRGLKGEPIVIGVYSGRTEDSGAVSTCSYEARELGIHAAMPIKNAKKKAENSGKEAHFIEMDKEYYDRFSDRIKKEILQKHAQKIEKASIDEFYIRIETEDYKKAEKMSEDIQASVKEEFDVTCSIGVGPNRLVAKIASDREKPEGLTVVKPEEVQEFMYSLEISDIHGIGDRTEEKLNNIGIECVKELAEADPALLVREFGDNQGLKLRQKARGEDDSEVEDSQQKQVTRITTLEENSRNFNKIKQVFPQLTSEIIDVLDEENMDYGSVSLVVIDTHIEMHTRSKSLKTRVRNKEAIIEKGEELLEEFLEASDSTVRRIGLRASDLKKRKGQKSMEQFF